MTTAKLPETKGIHARLDQAYSRIGAVEKNLARLTGDVGRALKAIGGDLQNISQACAGFDERLAAAIEVIGADEVRSAVAAARARREVAAQATMLEQIAKQVKDGRLRQTDKIVDAERDKDGAPSTVGSIFVGIEYDEAGNEIPPGKIVLRMADLREEFYAPLVGAAVGAEVPVPRMMSDGSKAVGPDGKEIHSKFHVLEIYEVVPKSPPSPPQEQAGEG